MTHWLKKRWFYHSLIWILAYLIVAVIVSINFPSDEWKTAYLSSLTNFIPLVPYVYLNLYFKRILYEKNKYLLYALAFLSIIAGGVVVYQVIYIFNPELRQHPFQDVINLFFVLVFTTGLQHLKRGVMEQFQLQELKVKNAQMELNALKAQVNPHFLFNTLNNIYGVNQADAMKGSEMIIELAEVMRYHLRFSRMKTIPFENELQLIQSYIELEKLRFQDNLTIGFQMSGCRSTSLRIEPLILLPFVENAFKHGTHPTRPCHIEATLELNDRDLRFKIVNSLFSNRQGKKNGLGIKNTQRRLAIIYPQKHNLNIERTESQFLLDLEMQL